MIVHIRVVRLACLLSAGFLIAEAVRARGWAAGDGGLLLRTTTGGHALE